MMLSAIILFAIALSFDIITDYRKYLHHKNINHSKEWRLKATMLLPSVILFGLATSVSWYFSIPVAAIMVATIYWFLFDGIYNIIRGFNWWFTGSDDPDDAMTDNILQSLNRFEHICVKIGTMAISIFIYIILK